MAASVFNVIICNQLFHIISIAAFDVVCLFSENFCGLFYFRTYKLWDLILLEASLITVKFVIITCKSVKRSCRTEVFCKKGVFKNFAKCTGKHLCRILFFKKVADFRPATLLKQKLRYRCFPVNSEKFILFASMKAL